MDPFQGEEGGGGGNLALGLGLGLGALVLVLVLCWSARFSSTLILVYSTIVR